MQSLEALQDGEHEKQRRHFLYFLLHQVTVSSNFSVLTRQRACQVLISSSGLSQMWNLVHIYLYHIRNTFLNYKTILMILYCILRYPFLLYIEVTLWTHHVLLLNVHICGTWFIYDLSSLVWDLVIYYDWCFIIMEAITETKQMTKSLELQNIVCNYSTGVLLKNVSCTSWA